MQDVILSRDDLLMPFGWSDEHISECIALDGRKKVLELHVGRKQFGTSWQTQHQSSQQAVGADTELC